MSEPRQLICGCSFDGYEFTGCSEHDLPVPSPVWSFPDLSDKENAIITKARINGYSSFFPCMDGGEKQARKTLAGAIGFLEGLKVNKAA